MVSQRKEGMGDLRLVGNSRTNVRAMVQCHGVDAGVRHWFSSLKSKRPFLFSLWLTALYRRLVEDNLNTFPNYKLKIGVTDVHFLALFSEKPEAVPLLLLHGWPGK